jgi:tetraacyldisaccharide 4'-kinase
LIAQALLKQWYGKPTWLWVFLPLVPVFMALAGLRKAWWRKRARKPALPLVVVGNITLGGTGKTPVVIALVNFLQSKGLSPGVISRGYGGNFSEPYCEVTPQTSPQLCGDEPVLIATACQCPVVVSSMRYLAVQRLAELGCDIAISDDGLQHYALARDLEIAVMDAARGLGNGWCLPLGPLREPSSRLQRVDWVLSNGGTDACGFVLQPQGWRHLQSQEPVALRPWPWGTSTQVCALAGIGNPERFFAQLRHWGLDVQARPFEDHHAYSPEDLAFAGDLPLLMTAKDAVKCRPFGRPNSWVLEVAAVLPEAFLAQFWQRIGALASKHPEDSL